LRVSVSQIALTLSLPKLSPLDYRMRRQC